MPDTESLLTEYVRNGSERAFRELVFAYVNFVYSTALRVVGGDAHQAEDVAQTVFIDLARKAAFLPANVRLGGWLHRHTCFVGRKALRKERRRAARERQAMQLHTIADYTEENLSQLALVLDEVTNKLGKADREAIILRFFEERDFRSLGEILGSSEDAARMRVSRALEKMGVLLKRRGIMLSVSGLSFVLGSKCVQAAPAALAAKASHAALAQSLHSFGALAVLKRACLNRLSMGLAGSAALVVLVLVLLPRGKSAAFSTAGGTATTPLEFAGLTIQEEEEILPVEITPAAPAVMPVTVAPPPQVVATPVPRPVVVVVKPKTNAPAPIKPVAASASPPQLSGGGGDSGGAGQIRPANSGQDAVPVLVNRRPIFPVMPITKTGIDGAQQTPIVPGQGAYPVTVGAPDGLQWQTITVPRAPILPGNKNGQKNRQRQP